MSLPAPERLQAIASFGAAFNEHGWAGVRAFLAPGVEFHEPPEQPGATVFHGVDAMMEGAAAWASAWSAQQSEIEHVEVLPDGRFLVLHRERLRGRDGIDVAQDAASVITFDDDGKVTCWKTFWDRANAYAAAGLEGPPAAT